MIPTVVQDACTYLMGNLARTKDQAIGIVAVMYAAESKLKTGSQGNQSTETPGALNPSGAYGIASWNGPRQAALAAFALRYGLKVDDLFTQLHFVLTESANSYPQVWAVMQNPATTYQEMIVAFTDYYENPANKQKEIDEAEAFAASIYDQVIAPTAGTPIPSPLPARAAVPPPVSAPAIPAPILAAGESIVAAALPLALGPLGPVASLALNPQTIALVTPLFEALFTSMIKAAIAAAPKT